MLTRELNDSNCLRLALLMVMELLRDPDVRARASKYRNKNELIADIRSRPQLYDAFWLPQNAPRLPCYPPMRARFDPPDPQCGERSITYLTYAEILDPDTPRTLVTIHVGDDLHVLPVEYTEAGPTPVILDPLKAVKDKAISQNLSYGAVAHMLGYGPGQPSPVASPLEWAHLVAEREGVQPSNEAELLAVAERYAAIYPGGRQGIAELAERFGESVVDAAKATAKDAARRAKKASKKAAKAGKKVAKEAVKVGKVAADEYKKRPEIGQILRGAAIGYGGPLAVLAIDVVENRLNKRGYTLGSMAESRDTDIFAFK